MAVKYECAACDRKFVDWGAEKLKFKCPECEGDLKSTAKATSKPKASKKPAPSQVESIAAPKRVTSFDDADADAIDKDAAVVGGDGDDDLDEDVTLDDKPPAGGKSD